jgi:hypothetical protein
MFGLGLIDLIFGSHLSYKGYVSRSILIAQIIEHIHVQRYDSIFTLYACFNSRLNLA